MDVNAIPIVSSTSAERGIVVAKALAVLTFGTRTDRAAARNSCGRILCTKEARGEVREKRKKIKRKAEGERRPMCNLGRNWCLSVKALLV